MRAAGAVAAAVVKVPAKAPVPRPTVGTAKYPNPGLVTLKFKI